MISSRHEVFELPIIGPDGVHYCGLVRLGHSILCQALHFSGPFPEDGVGHVLTWLQHPCVQQNLGETRQADLLQLEGVQWSAWPRASQPLTKGPGNSAMLQVGAFPAQQPP